jgi:uroporphyrinogen decarboxylase
MLRRKFLFATAAATVVRGAALGPKERIDRAIGGTDVDRPPFTLWHHFGLNSPEEHARATLMFQQKYRTDLVKVMSDFPYPRSSGKWYELKPDPNPFAPQLRALELIRDGLDGRKYFVETVFNPWNVAEKLSSAEEVQQFRKERPQILLDALDIITQSEVNHVKRALATGAAGILLSVANAKSSVLSPEDYQRFSAPFDKRILQAVSGARLNILHLHVEPSHIDLFHDFPSTAINYSVHVSGIPIADVRRRYGNVIMGGIDEVNYRKLTAAEIAAQWKSAQKAAGKKFMLSPGCSVPNDSTTEELERLPQVLGV